MSDMRRQLHLWKTICRLKLRKMMRAVQMGSDISLFHEYSRNTGQDASIEDACITDAYIAYACITDAYIAYASIAVRLKSNNFKGFLQNYGLFCLICV